jgi:hypothetical protein
MVSCAPVPARSKWHARSHFIKLSNQILLVVKRKRVRVFESMSPRVPRQNEYRPGHRRRRQRLRAADTRAPRLAGRGPPQLLRPWRPHHKTRAASPVFFLPSTIPTTSSSSCILLEFHSVHFCHGADRFRAPSEAFRSLGIYLVQLVRKLAEGGKCVRSG